MSLTTKKSDAVPMSEFSDTFVQGMYDRMAVSYFKYGPLKRGFPDKVDAIGTLQECLATYAVDGNTEHLIDAANYCMIEFIAPRHPEAHFAATDSSGSVGRKKNNGVISTKHNLDLK